VPVVVHEQTAAVGLANAWAGKMAARVAITFAQSAQYFASNKVVLTGNPLQPAIVEPNMPELAKTELGQWLSRSDKPLIYITGGGLGSHIINVAVEQALPRLLTTYRVVHQCGAHAGLNDFDRLKELRQRSDWDNEYWLAKHFSPAEVGLLYAKVSLVVGRAGANTVLELAAVGQLAVLIPIPWVTHDEQTKNARVLEQVGTAVILPEVELTPERLESEIDGLMKRSAGLDQARQKARQLVDRRAAERLTELVLEVGSK
jgi:UDP-N-acetylglucosamine--N-acetylmuramyl-(pentapeptide) pyrophosphoryl-undecaprenol N-acetylglucosamine transferase